MKKKLTKIEINTVLDILQQAYPDARAELDFRNPFELLIATILSAQCTDARVNKTTKILFDRFKKPSDYIELGVDKLEESIRSCGLSNTKSKNIIETCKMLKEDYSDLVPNTIEELIKLPGVGRKTANVVVSNAFGVPAIAVDTHVFRVSNRIGLAHSNNVKNTEIDLQKSIPRDKWTKAHHILIFHGRRVCKARKPLCEQCFLGDYCLYYRNGEK